ncbi:MAG: DEAD/DEAH box helicase [Nitrososphaerota archaeon]|jgi:helicase|nr:DEAD/DEAH box helicase [Nitrososphaerota archaeon]
MQIFELAVPRTLKEKLTEQGYRELYPTQEEAVRAGLLEGKNLLLSTPTASGKTLVAMLAAGKVLGESSGRVAYLAPLRALAYEKFEEFQVLEEATRPNGKRPRIMVSTGDFDSAGESLLSADVLILTNEKFDSLTRQKPEWVRRFSLFIIDEVHLLGDKERGATLEIVVAKVKTMNPNAQILALSATVQNGAQIAEWLGASHVSLNWRPVPLKEGVAYQGKIYFSDGSYFEVPAGEGLTPTGIALDAVRNGGQSLVFAETRKRAVALALGATKLVSRLLSFDELARLREAGSEILSGAEETAISRMLRDCVVSGVAFHHAGLAAAHRRIVEKEFKEGRVKILFATPTVSAGVNLPARRVILASVNRYDSNLGMNRPIEVMDYKQMSGRAGRPKYDSYGEAVLLAHDEDEMRAFFDVYVKGVPEAIRSQLYASSTFRKHTLGVIATSSKTTERELRDFFMNTLLAKQTGEESVAEKLEASLEYLLKNLLVSDEGGVLKPTRLGKRIATLYIDPETGLFFTKLLGKTGDTDEDLSLGYLEAVIASPDFGPKMQLRAKDQPEYEAFEEAHGSRLLLPMEEDWARSLMVLSAWMNETSDGVIFELYGVEPGDLHRSVEMAEWLCYSFRELAKLEGMKRTSRVIDLLRLRVAMGVKPELIPLVSLEGVGRVRARNLFNAGFKSISAIANARVGDLARVQRIGEVVANRIKKQAEELTSRVATEQERLD